MQNALIYCRVSTEEQVQEGYSLDTQEKCCRKFAESNGYKVAGVYRDEGKSGTNLDRPALKDLLSKVQKGKSPDAVIVQETDRLARNTKDHLTVRALLRKAKVNLISVAQPMLDDSPEGRMVDTIIASVNQFQSDINSRKVQRGLQEKFNSGWWPGWAPLGYLNKTKGDSQKVVVPDPERWHLVRDGLKMYLSGNYSAAQIADTLYQQGLRSKSGRKVCNNIMTNTLKNPFYAGIMRWKGQERKGKHKPMISSSEHKRLLEIMDDHNFHACRRRKHGFLLLGFAFCNICGARYTAETHPKKSKAYYHCTFRGKRGKEKAHTNRGQNVEVSTLEKQVEEKFKDIQFSPDFIDLVVEKMKAVNAQQKRVLESRKKRVHNKKLAIEKKRDIIEEKLLDGVISDKDFIRIKGKLEKERSLLQNQLDDLENQHNYDFSIIEEVLRLTRNIYRTYKTSRYELKRHYLALFWEKFLVQDRKIIKAIPTPLLGALIRKKRVIISDGLDRQLRFIITLLEDWKYIEMLKEKLVVIRRFYNESLKLSAAASH